MSVLKFWLWLSTKQSLNEERKAALIDAMGDPITVYQSDTEEFKSRFNFTERQLAELADKNLDRAERVLEHCEERGVKLLCMQDAAYPDRLRALHDPPLVLYYRGHIPVMDEEAAVGIVGTRRCTAYGASVALRLGFQLAKSGVLVVSGMASGIDGIAQKGALRAGKPTIAVLGTGPDVVYPSEHRHLYEDIITMGAVVSEYPPGSPTERQNFPKRNRLISGLSLGVVIVEAPRGSGALITANHALDQDRDVFAVPGAIDVRESEGCHRLIREGAILVSCAEDILDEYRAVYAHKLAQKPPPPEAMPRLPSDAKPVKKAARQDKEAPSAPGEQTVTDLSARFASYEPEQQMILYTLVPGPRETDEIIRDTMLDAELVLGELSLLELDGVIEKTGGGRFRLTKDGK